jgi:hypothetical protein
MQVCAAWQAAIQAAPELWPTTVLTAPPLKVNLQNIAHFRNEEYWMQQLREQDGFNAAKLLSKAAQLSPLAWQVRLEGFDNQVCPVYAQSWQPDCIGLMCCGAHISQCHWSSSRTLAIDFFYALQPALVVAVLAVLPLGVCVLELAAHCAGPVLEALQRLSLKELHLSGNGAGITWGRPRVATCSVLPNLMQLRLDHRQRPHFEIDGTEQTSEVHSVPDGIAVTLGAATRLRTLALRLKWSDGVPAMCSALPSLLELR